MATIPKSVDPPKVTTAFAYDVRKMSRLHTNMLSGEQIEQIRSEDINVFINLKVWFRIQ